MRDNQYLEVEKFDLIHQVVSVTNSAAQILPSNVRRVGLYFSTPSTVNEMWVAPHVITAVNDGFTVFSNNVFLRFTFDTDGILPFLEWWAIGNAVAEDLYILEILYNPAKRKVDLP